MSKNNKIVPALIARPKSGGVVEVASYVDDNVTMIANSSATGIKAPLSCNDKVLMPRGDKVIALEDSDFEDLVVLASCASCEHEIHTTPEFAAIAHQGDNLACPNCSTIVAIDCASSLPPSETAEDGEESDEVKAMLAELDDLVLAGKDQDDQDDDQDQQDHEEDEDQEDEEGEQEDQNDDEEDEDAEQDNEDEDQDEQQNDDDEDEEKASVMVNFSSDVDFDLNTMVVANLGEGRHAIFAEEAGNLLHIGTLIASKATPENAALLKSDSLVVASAVRAVVETANDLIPLGFEPVIREVKIASILEDRSAEVASTVEAASKTAVEEWAGVYRACLGSAVVAINKGLRPNPLVDELASILAKHGVVKPHALAKRAVASSMDSYMRAVLEAANEMAEHDPAAREALAQFVAKATTSSDGEDEIVEGVHTISTASLNAVEDTAPVRSGVGGNIEVSSAKPYKRLFR